jgi:DNA-binding NarL/FixJ family response regulator
MNKINIIIVEDRKEIREELADMIRSQSHEFTLLHSFENGDLFMENIKDYRPDVVLMDINMPGTNGIECIAQTKRIRSEIQFLICTVFEDHQHIYEALCAGATGYILKSTTSTKLFDAIHEIYQGGSPMSAMVARLVVSSFNAREQQNRMELQKLSTREREVLELLAQGFRNKEIAGKLFVSQETIKSHLKNIYEKLQVNSRNKAIEFLKR